MISRRAFLQTATATAALAPLARAKTLSTIGVQLYTVRNVLPHLSDEQLEGVFPETLAGHSFSTADFIMHLCSHFAYHLGQVDYHRRILTGEGKTVKAMALTELGGKAS